MAAAPTFKNIDQWIDWISTHGGTAAIQKGDVPPPPGMDPDYWRKAVEEEGVLSSSKDFWSDNSKPGGTINKNVFAHLKQAATKASNSFSSMTDKERRQFEAEKVAPSQQELLNRIKTDAEKTSAENTKFYDTAVNPALAAQGQAQYGAAVMDANALRSQDRTRDKTQDALNSVAKDYAATATGANKQSSAELAGLKGSVAGLDASDRSALSRYDQETNPLMTERKARGYGADVQSDAEGLKAQRDALGFAQGAAGGSLSYRSGGSDVADGMWDHASQGDAVAGGKFDYESQASHASADEQDVNRQREALDLLRKDVETGGADQRDALNKYKSLTDPELTAKERFLMAQSRQSFEGKDKSNQDAVLQDLKQRGLNSGTLQIVNNLASQQRLGQDRTMSELGARASAVDRAMAALGGEAATAGQLRTSDQAGLNQLYSGSADARKQGFTEAYGRGTAADSASSDNQSARVAGVGLADAAARGNQSTRIAGMSAADAAMANNQQTRMQGGQLAGTTAGQIRTAADAISQFNKTESQTTQRFQDAQAAQEAARLGNLADTRLYNTTNTNQGIGTRAFGTNTAAQDVITDNANRSNVASGVKGDTARDVYSMDSDYNAMVKENAANGFNRATTTAGTGISAATGRAGVTSVGLDQVTGALKLLAGDEDAKKAAKLLA